ncbi:MAG: hypothetical protein ACJ8FA_12270 [Xanthobacteraceae bacterium]
MPAKAATALTALLLVFGAAPGALADMPDQRGLFFGHSMPLMSQERIPTMNDAPTQKAVVASQLELLQKAFFCRGGITDGTIWLKLTEPGGKRIHINLEHITSVRSDTQVPGARAQLDLTSGKFQGVQEDIEEVMQLISAASSARESGDNTLGRH